MLLQAVFAAAGSLAFAVLLGVPRRYLLAGAACGGIGWWVYLLVISGHHSSVLAVASAAAVSAGLSEILARRFRSPATLFLVPAIIPLVPGILIYQSMLYVVAGKPLLAITGGATALLWGAGIAGGIAAIAFLIRLIPGQGGSQRW